MIEIFLNILVLACILGLFSGIIFFLLQELQQKKKSNYSKQIKWSFIICAASALLMLGLDWSGLLQGKKAGDHPSESQACNCEEELKTWAMGGSTYNSKLKEDCMEKYAFFRNLTTSTGYLSAWHDAKKECDSLWEPYLNQEEY